MIHVQHRIYKTFVVILRLSAVLKLCSEANIPKCTAYNSPTAKSTEKPAMSARNC